MADEIVLSILVPTYNHERYIARALRSIVEQEKPFSYEVLVGEDASTDNTKEIIQKFEKDYPGVFTVFYRKENMHRQEITNGRDLHNRCKGKYVITLEGDDYWTDSQKLKKQVEFLEKHEEYIACAHRCIVVDENNEEIKKKYEECKNNEFTLKDFKNYYFPGQTATVLYRNIYADDSIDTSILELGLSPGDSLRNFVLLSYGKVYRFDEIMSAYRYVTTKGDSFSANKKITFESSERWHRELLAYAKRINKRKSIIAAEHLYSRIIIAGYKDGDISGEEFRRLFAIIDHKISTLFAWVIFKMKIKILDNVIGIGKETRSHEQCNK